VIDWLEISKMQHKTKLRIHNSCNKYTRYYRYYNFFWDALTYELGKTFEIEENRYFEHAHTIPMPIKLKKAKCDLEIYESDYVIENVESGDFYILTACDVLTGHVIAERENPHLKKVLVAQYIDQIIKHNVENPHTSKYSPWIYFQSGLTNLEEYFYKRKLILNFNKKLYFRGKIDDRPILKYFSPSILESGQTINQNDYFNEAINHEIGLSIGGVGELCYRDIEYMGMGIPFLRFEFASSLKEPLIPNVHYISVDRPNDLPTEQRTCGVGLDRMGLEHHAKLIEQRYLEVIDDKEFLRFVSTNAREYYEKYLMYPNNVRHTINWLGLE